MRIEITWNEWETNKERKSEILSVQLIEKERKLKSKKKKKSLTVNKVRSKKYRVYCKP